MADRPLDTALPADLPEDWTSGQIVAPAGADVGLSEQHGYNYLMAAVNAAQRAANAINESFDAISGKRTCRFVIGTSTAGWTEADCDYLCDGVDDQVEIQAAIDAAPKDGCEIVLLDGEYHLSDAITVGFDIWLHGNGVSTKIIRDAAKGLSSINYMIAAHIRAALSDFNYIGNKEAAEGEFEILLVGDNIVENVVFSSCGYGCLYLQSINVASSVSRIRRCKCLGISDYGTFSFIRAQPSNQTFVVEENFINETQYLLDLPDAVRPNATFIKISGNFSAGHPGAVLIDSYSGNGSYGTIINGNVLSRVEVYSTIGDAGVPNETYRGALIYGNIFSAGEDTAITLGPNTRNNFVFGNTLWAAYGSRPSTILDQGIDNIIRNNSDDTSSGGGGETAGVSTFNGRSGAVRPQTGDYTAEMVGAVPAAAVASIQSVTQAEYDALTTKNSTTLYLIKE